MDSFVFMMDSLPLLSIIALTPAVAAAIILLLPEKMIDAARTFAVMASSITLGITVWLFSRQAAWPDVTGYLWPEKRGWLPELGISYDLATDGLSLPMLLAVSCILFTAIITALSHASKKRLICLLLSGTCFLSYFAAFDLFFIFIFIGSAPLPLFFLAQNGEDELSDKVQRTDTSSKGASSKKGAERSSKSALSDGAESSPALNFKRAMKASLLHYSGALLVLLCFIGIYSSAQQNTFSLLELAKANVADAALLYLSAAIGFAVMAGVIPASFIFSEALASAYRPAAMLLCLMPAASGYGLLRTASIVPKAAAEILPYIAIWAIISAIVSFAIAINKASMRKRLAYIVTGESAAAIFFITAAAIKNAELALSGAVLFAFAATIACALMVGLSRLCESASSSRIGASALFAGSLALAGVPGLSGFSAYLAIITGLRKSNMLMALGAIIIIVIAAICLLRPIRQLLFDTDRESAPDIRARLTEKLAFVLLTVILPIFGIFPRYIIDMASSAIRIIAAQITY